VGSVGAPTAQVGVTVAVTTVAGSAAVATPDVPVVVSGVTVTGMASLSTPTVIFGVTVSTASAVLILTAQPVGSAAAVIPPMLSGAPSGQSRQGDSTYDTYKRRTFNA
jgi:hypothetical protein